MAYLIKRAFDHLRFMDFSVIPGKTGYVLWKLGVIKFWQRFFLRHYHVKNNSPKMRPEISIDS